MLIAISLLVILLFFAFLLWYYKQVYFYRDPVRIPPAGEKIILSPADGNIVYIKKFKEGKIISQKLDERIKISEITKSVDFGPSGFIIGIYMKPTDVHFNYAPISGTVKSIIYTPSKYNLPMVDLWEYFNLVFLHRLVSFWSKKFHWHNERQTILLEGKDIKVGIVEIADKFVNKIDCFVKEGDKIKAGQKISFIKRGSQVDLIIYKEDLDIKVKKGDQVYGAQTILVSFE